MQMIVVLKHKNRRDAEDAESDKKHVSAISGYYF